MFDQFVKHELRVSHYARYTDDFIIVAENKEYLQSLLLKIENFLLERMKLSLHPNKVFITPFHRGIDFLGHVILPWHVVPRTKTKRRIWKKLKININQYKKGLISEKRLKAGLQSYLGVLSHGNAYRLKENLKNQFWFWLKE